MSDFTEKFIDNTIELAKHWMIGFGMFTYPLWMLQSFITSEWLPFTLLAFTPILVLTFAFIMTFQRYKDQKSLSNK